MSTAILRARGGPEPLAGLVDAAQATITGNIVPGRTPDEPARYLRAGGGYDDPWTRDAAINAWQAGCWLIPEVTGATLDMVCQPGQDVVTWDTQWWDQVIWVIGAWHQAVVTGDRARLERAHRVGTATVRRLEQRLFDPVVGLFRGPAVMADGITGYPVALHDPALPAESFVLDHPATHRVYALSTNCLYVWTYRLLATMASGLGLPDPGWEAAADRLAGAVRAGFGNAEGSWAYLLSPDRPATRQEPWREIEAGGRTLVGYDYQEATGLALLVLSQVVTSSEGAALLRRAWRAPRGVPTLAPHLPGYDDLRFGRHNVACWPMVMGVWAQAVAATGDNATFGNDLAALAGLIGGSRDAFYELYHPVTGLPDGGWQALRQWRSEPDQTWSATAYLGCLLYGVFGLRPQWDGLGLRPCVPAGYDDARLSGLPWRRATLDLAVHGSGGLVRACLDTEPLDHPVIPTDLTGHHRVDLYCQE